MSDGEDGEAGCGMGALRSSVAAPSFKKNNPSSRATATPWHQDFPAKVFFLKACKVPYMIATELIVGMVTVTPSTYQTITEHGRHTVALSNCLFMQLYSTMQVANDVTQHRFPLNDGLLAIVAPAAAAIQIKKCQLKAWYPNIIEPVWCIEIEAKTPKPSTPKRGIFLWAVASAACSCRPADIAATWATNSSLCFATRRVFRRDSGEHVAITDRVALTYARSSMSQSDPHFLKESGNSKYRAGDVD